MLEELGLKGGAPCWRQVGCPGKAVVASPARTLPRETTSPSGSSCFYLGVALILCCGSDFLSLPCLSVVVGAALTARAQIRGTKERPYFSTPILTMILS